VNNSLFAFGSSGVGSGDWWLVMPRLETRLCKHQDSCLVTDMQGCLLQCTDFIFCRE